MITMQQNPSFKKLGFFYEVLMSTLKFQFVFLLLSALLNDQSLKARIIFVPVFIVIGFIGAGLFSGWLFYLSADSGNLMPLFHLTTFPCINE
jgi:hypothetical protein